MKAIGFFILVFIAFLAPGCTKENIGQFDDAIVESSSNLYKFKQIWFTISIQSASNGFLNLNRIDSLKLKVNGKAWGTFTSEEVDTTGKTTLIADHLKYSSLKLEYLIIAPLQLKTQNFDTAGDIVNYLDNRLVLTPGDYVFEIAEIKFRDLMNQWRTVKPSVYKSFKVVENTTSSFAGEVSINLK